MTAEPPSTTFKVVYTRLLRLRRLWPDPVTVDWLLGIVLVVGAELAIWLGHDAAPHRLGPAAVALVMGLLAFRRRYPLLAGTAVTVLLALDHTLWDPQFVGYPIGNFCALYALAVWTSTRGFLLGVAAFAGATVALSASTEGGATGTLPYTVVALVVMILVRRVVGDRERRAQLAERERDLAAREAVVEERARIARELHDVIAHNVSMMVVQAGAERRVLDEDSSSTREVLEMVEQIGRAALTEMRRLVGMLRGDAADPLAPQPGLRDLPRLVSQVREAGLPVDLHMEGEPRQLPVGIDLSAYRIVQEALTNTLKHAGEARAAVRVNYGPDTLELEIADTGTGGATGAAIVGSAGHGLVGMRERVALYGGRLDTGRGPGGGFSVRVVLPIR